MPSLGAEIEADVQIGIKTLEKDKDYVIGIFCAWMVGAILLILFLSKVVNAKKNPEGEYQPMEYEGGEADPLVAKYDEAPLCCCQDAMIDVSEETALVLFILSIFGYGIIGSCLDRKGCNMSIFLINFIPVVCVIIHY